MLFLSLRKKGWFDFTACKSRDILRWWFQSNRLILLWLRKRNVYFVVGVGCFIYYSISFVGDANDDVAATAAVATTVAVVAVVAQCVFTNGQDEINKCRHTHCSPFIHVSPIANTHLNETNYYGAGAHTYFEWGSKIECQTNWTN